MWACATYWAPPDYLESSTREVYDNVKRVQYHASIAVWAGNNENTCSPGSSGAKYYGELYFGTVLDHVAALDPTRPRMVSSPSGGNETEDDPCPYLGYNPFYGDIHQCVGPGHVFLFDAPCLRGRRYLYDQDCWNISVYSRGQFMSEVTTPQPLLPAFGQWVWRRSAVWTAVLVCV